MKILGHKAQRKTAGRIHPLSDMTGKDRIIVEGFNHQNGFPIRFKGVKRAENHIRNCGVVAGETEVA